MSNRPQFPDDEPVIGFAPGSTATALTDSPVIGDESPVTDDHAPGETDYEPEDDYPEDELEPYYSEYVRESPAQSPWFYAFLVAAALIGAAFVFVIVRSIDTGGDDDETPEAVSAQILQVQLAAPRDGDWIVADEPATFGANVASSEPITKVELLIDDKVYAEGSATEADTQPQGSPAAQAKLYDAVVTASFSARGEHTAALRITSGDEVRETTSIRIVIVEAPDDPRVETRVIATTSVRTGPGDTFPESERLEPGATVLVVARTADSEWLMIDDESAGEHWIRRNAVQDTAALVSLPVRTALPTPPTQTPTPSDAETPIPTPIGGPDFAPADARFVFSEGGRGALRVSIVNNGSDFSGPLVIQASISNGNLVASQIVIDLSLRSGAGATVDFEVSGSLPAQANVTVVVDPGDAVSESNEDNNTANFSGVGAPADPPEIVISSIDVSGSEVTVVITNLGGPLPASEISVVVSVGGAQQSQSTSTDLGTDETATFTITAPGTGTGTVQVLINGATVQTAPVEVSSPTATSTASATATPTETVTATATTS